MKTKKKINPSAFPVLTETLDETQTKRKKIPILTDILSPQEQSPKENAPKTTFKPRTTQHNKSQTTKTPPKIVSKKITVNVPAPKMIMGNKETASEKSATQNPAVKSTSSKPGSAPPIGPNRQAPVAKKQVLHKASPPPKRAGVLIDQSSFQELEERLSERVQKQIIERLTSTVDHYLLRQVSSILEKTLNLLSDEIKTEMQQSLESIVSQAISDEIKSLKQRINKINKL